MTPSENNRFTAADIERYHSGKMSPDERHALEKAALDDPFLADALEGYAFAATPAADLASIQSRLDEKLERKKPIPLFQKYKWLSVAAIVMIIAGAAWLTYSISGGENKSSLASNKEEVQKEPPASLPPQVNSSLDSSLPTRDVVDNTPSIETRKKGSPDYKAGNSGAAKNKNEVLANDLKIKEVSGLTSPSSSPGRPLSSDQNAVVSSNNTFANAQKPEMNMNRARIPDARAANPMLQRETYFKDSNEDKSTYSGSLRQVNVHDTLKNFNVVLQPQKMDSAQMVVVGYGEKKKSMAPYPRVTIDTLEPAGGATNFDYYVASNLKMPEELKAKIVSGEVQLSFDVDKDGQPVNITVLKSLCQKCDEEAVRLLKEGPKWKQKKNKKGKITIKF